MSEQRLPRHGRNHRAKGSDPIWPGDPLFFNVDNEGGYLYVQINDTVDLDTLPDPLAIGGTWGGAIEEASGDGLLVGSTTNLLLYSTTQTTLEGGSLSLFADTLGINLDSQQAFDMHVRSGVSEWDMDDGLAIVSSGSLTFTVDTGQVFEVRGTGSAAIFRMDANGDAHIKTGKTITADL